MPAKLFFVPLSTDTLARLNQSTVRMRTGRGEVPQITNPRRAAVAELRNVLGSGLIQATGYIELGMALQQIQGTGFILLVAAPDARERNGEALGRVLPGQIVAYRTVGVNGRTYRFGDMKVNDGFDPEFVAPPPVPAPVDMARVARLSGIISQMVGTRPAAGFALQRDGNIHPETDSQMLSIQLTGQLV